MKGFAARRTAVALSVALALTSHGVAFAAPQATSSEDVARAKTLFDDGSRAMQSGRFAEAVTALRASLDASPRSATAFNLAVALRGTGDSLAAIALFDALLAGKYGALDASKEQGVTELRDATKRDLATLSILVRGAPSEVRIDGKDPTSLTEGMRVERRVNPGKHRVIVVATDRETADREVDLKPGATATLEIDLRAARDERPGHLTVACADTNATITIEGQGSGRGQLERDLPAGDYVVIAKNNSGERRARVAVPAGRRVQLTLDAPAQARSLLEKPLFWVITGTVVAGGVVTAIVVAKNSKRDPVTSPVWGVTTASLLRW
jgi:hypothetical protein